MKAGSSLLPPDVNEEISALIATLHQTGQRLEQLTSGEVDTVADAEGRTFLLPQAQEELRHGDAARQAAILNALPAHIALLDAQGTIVSVNAAWRRFAGANFLLSPAYGVGLNYLEVCDGARGIESCEAVPAAAGIRSILDGKAGNYTIEYRCDAPDELRWFQMTVTPLSDSIRKGAVVMHMDVTAEKKVQARLLASELRFRQMAENITAVFFLQSNDGSRIHYVSPAYEQLWGRSCESLYANPESWVEAIHPDDRASTYRKYREGMITGKFELEYRILRPDGTARAVSARIFPVLDDAGAWIRIAGIVEDVTRRTQDRLELEESERRFSDLLQNVELVSVMFDREARITFCNEYLLRLTGWSLDEVIGRNWFDHFVPPDRWGSKAMLETILRTRPKVLHHENEILKRSGERRLIRWNTSLLRSGSGEVIGVASIGEDITQKAIDERSIRRLNRVHAVLSGINTLIVRVRDRQELFQDACRIAVEAGGFRMAMIGIVDPATLRFMPMASAGVDDRLMARINEMMASDGAGETMIARAMEGGKAVVSNDSLSDPQVVFGKTHAEAGGRSIAVLPLMVAGKAAGALVIYAGETDFFLEDELKLLTELADDVAFAIDHLDKQERLNYLAYYDPLTGLANRSLFLERAAQHLRGATAGGHKVAVCLVDLERFKNINDSLGRAAGDTLLKQVAQWLARKLEDVSLLAHIGADHFAVMLPEIREGGDATRLLEQTIKGFMDHPFVLDDAVLRIAAKIGIAMFPDDGSDAEALLLHAESALKKAKASGDRYVFYTQRMSDRIAGRLTLENQLRQALENMEFELYYEPKINVATGKISGSEALIRWNDPRTGLVPPVQFIPILEETGLIHEVGRWALHQAIEDYRRRRAAGLLMVRIAVNVSPLQLRSPRFIAEIEQAIGGDSEAAAGLELEITESLIMEDVRHSIACLQAIRTLGVTIAIDDFGTGFSSLSYLSRLPLDALKIDRSFVTEMTLAPEGLALVSTIIGLAHSLKLRVVAEGVETEEQSRLLRLLGCDQVQGYLFGKAMPGGIFETQFLGPTAAG